MGSIVLLGHTFFQNVFHVMVPQGLLEFLLSGGIDPLSDDHRFGAEFHGSGIGTDYSSPLFLGKLHRQIVAGCFQLADMLRGGAAAAAHHKHTHFRDFPHLPGKLV